MIEVLLKENIDELGRRGEVVKVANGYARNYLLPRQLAMPVTASNQRQVEREQAAAAAREAEEQQAAQALAARIASLTCVIARRVGETETLYGSVTSSDLADFLSAQQVDIDKRKIQLREPIKELGEFTVPIKLHREVTATLAVQVIKADAETDGGANSSAAATP